MTPMSNQYYLQKMLMAMKVVDAMPQAARDEIANGCGPKGALIDLIDDDPFGADFGPACEAHDIGYHIGENDEDKTVADLLFLHMMVLSIIYNKTPKIIKKLQLDMAMQYFEGVFLHGKDAFYAGKRKEKTR